MVSTIKVIRTTQRVYSSEAGREMIAVDPQSESEATRFMVKPAYCSRADLLALRESIDVALTDDAAEAAANQTDPPSINVEA